MKQTATSFNHNNVISLSIVYQLDTWLRDLNTDFTLGYCLFGTVNTARKTIFSFSKCSEKIVFLKEIALEYNLSCIVRKDDISFSRKYDLIL